MGKPIVEQNEVNTEYLMHILQGKDKNIIVSKSDVTNYKMTHYLMTDATIFKKNQWHIPEPIDGFEVSSKQMDVVFVPLLAFDLQGNRVGYGKGFYDRFLNECHADVVKIGLSFFEPETEIEGTENTDVRLNFALTPESIHSF